MHCTPKQASNVLCTAQGKALSEKRQSGALEAQQRQALSAVQRTAAEMATATAEATTAAAELRAQQAALEAQASGASEECRLLRAREDELRIATATAGEEKHKVLCGTKLVLHARCMVLDECMHRCLNAAAG